MATFPPHRLPCTISGFVPPGGAVAVLGQARRTEFAVEAAATRRAAAPHVLATRHHPLPAVAAKQPMCMPARAAMVEAQRHESAETQTRHVDPDLHRHRTTSDDTISDWI
jgi:nicotinamidase-related amidase